MVLKPSPVGALSEDGGANMSEAAGRGSCADAEEVAADALRALMEAGRNGARTTGSGRARASAIFCFFSARSSGVSELLAPSFSSKSAPAASVLALEAAAAAVRRLSRRMRTPPAPELVLAAAAPPDCGTASNLRFFAFCSAKKSRISRRTEKRKEKKEKIG
jgi:hypothetical protein